MSDIAIRVENLSKLYHLGAVHQRPDTLRDALTGFLPRISRKGKEDSLNSPNSRQAPDSDDLWALKNVSFEIKRGEVVGIIGRNGAGKSTLLKILSRITEPTSGIAEIHGRVGSLLEVGTGFHPELTGRENIFLNGAILGMHRVEIQRRFDEIVAFAEIERFLDTPVKRYSSGMYVRLAFAVAAHLEPEILLVDEVLAVGDAAFQRKCLGKMGDVAKEGRTVLFVSHNMAAVQNLCARSILVLQGELVMDCVTSRVINAYLNSLSQKTTIDLRLRTDRSGCGNVFFTSVELLNQDHRPADCGVSGQPLIVRLHYQTRHQNIAFANSRASLSIHRNGQVFFLASTELTESNQLNLRNDGYLDCYFPRLPLSQSDYDMNIFLESGGEIQDWVESAARLSVIDGDYYGTGKNYPPGWAGQAVLVDYSWSW